MLTMLKRPCIITKVEPQVFYEFCSCQRENGNTEKTNGFSMNKFQGRMKRKEIEHTGLKELRDTSSKCKTCTLLDSDSDKPAVKNEQLEKQNSWRN